ncbi:MAG TPA: DEAD/DEAH box helicase [Streptosporangiaceae bacterium]|nr:DEAD/DEAH box helicase [Streptosporangiaceae bacterium]
MHDNARRQRAPRHPGHGRTRSSQSSSQSSPGTAPSGRPPAGRSRPGRPEGQPDDGRRRPRKQQSGPRGGGQRAGSQGRPGRRRGAAGPGPSGRPSAPAGPAAELDRALAAALAAPPPEATTFAALGLPDALVAALAARGISEPFAIQSRALPDALAGRDVLGKAQTGSGKTLAFGLPVLARLASWPDGGRAPRRAKAPRALVLVPTRELAVQVADVLQPLGRVLGVTVTTVYGGVSIPRQIDVLARGVDLVVATPGRLIDLLDRGACTLDGIEITVLDEADHMADLGFMPAVTKILDKTPAGAQRLLFSATLDRGVAQLVTAYLSDPSLCAVASTEIEAGTAEHSMLVLDAQDKVTVAAEIASRPARTLFFVRTKHGADRLARQFSRAGVEAAAIHGNLSQNQRRRALAGFAAGHPRVLVATDVAARGIHVDDVELVVHFDPPNDHKDYLHRSGRTARAGADGLVVALVEESQVREVERLHQSAGITSTRHHVVSGHEVVRKIATSGTPVPPPPPAPEPAAAPRRAKPRGHRPRQARDARAGDPRGRDGRTGSARRRPGAESPAQPGRRSQPGQPGRRSQQAQRRGPSGQPR